MAITKVRLAAVATVATAITLAAGALAQSGARSGDTMGRDATGPLTGFGVSGTGATTGSDAVTGNSTGTGATLGPGPAPGTAPSPTTGIGRSTGPITGTGPSGVAPGAPLTAAPGMTGPRTFIPGTTLGRVATRDGRAAARDARAATRDAREARRAALAAEGFVPGLAFPGPFGFGPAFGFDVFAPGLWGASAFGAYGSGFTPGYGPGVYRGSEGTDLLNADAIPGAPGEGTSGIPFGTRESEPAIGPTGGEEGVDAVPEEGSPDAVAQPEVPADEGAPPAPPAPPAGPEGIGATGMSNVELVRAPIGSVVTLTSPVTTVFGPQVFAVAGPAGDQLVLLPREPTTTLTPETPVTVTGTVRPFVDADVYAAQGYFDADPALIEEMRRRPVLVARSLERDGLSLLTTDDAPAEPTPIAANVSAIAANPAQYEGARVTLRGDVVDVDTPQMFTLNGAPGEVAVVNPTPLSDNPLHHEVTITGVVRRYTDELRNEYPWLSTNDSLEGRPVVVAELVMQE